MSQKDVTEIIEINGIETREDVDRLEQALRSMEGVEVHEVGLSEVRISYSAHDTTADDISAAIEDLGFTVHATRRES